MAELSPMMQQYMDIKKQYKDEILFYRIGDFYEMFFDDALTASRELDLTLTGKQCGMEERAPMCGVPFHSYEGYVARLIAKGYKVAICEQMEDPSKAKGLVKRDIIRVVTPGTVIESSMLQDDKNNYIASIFLKGNAAGICFADVSTGTAHITELKREKIVPAVIAELCRYHPSEVLMNPGMLDCRELTGYIKKNMTCSVELVEEERYAPGLVAISLENQFGRNWDETTSIDKKGLVRFAMAALLEYLHTTQIKGVDSTKRETFVELGPNAKLYVTEKLMTHDAQHAISNMEVKLNGEGSSARIISRSVAKGTSNQIFHPKAIGNNACHAHVQCDSIIMDKASISSIPEINANHIDAQIIHEAAIGRINDEQLIKLRTFGMTEEEAEAVIIENFLN